MRGVLWSIVLAGSVLASAALAAPAPMVMVCHSEEYSIYKVPAFRQPDGTLLMGDRPLDVRALAQARGLDWFEAGEPLIYKGATYRKVGEPRPETWTLGRYNRFKGRYRGAPMMEPLGGEDRAMLVLVDPVGCVFQRYMRDDDPTSGAR